MNKDPDKHRSKTEKLAYIRNLEVKLAEKKAALRFVKRKIKLATETGRIHASEQLLKAEDQADACATDLRARLDQLQSADDDSWEQVRYRVDTAWDDLSQSIRKIVARFP